MGSKTGVDLHWIGAFLASTSSHFWYLDPPTCCSYISQGFAFDNKLSLLLALVAFKGADSLRTNQPHFSSWSWERPGFGWSHSLPRLLCSLPTWCDPMTKWHPSATSTSSPNNCNSNLSVVYVSSHWPVGKRTLTLVQLAPKSYPIPQLWSQLHETMKPSDQAKKYVHPSTSEIRLPTPGFSAGMKRPGHKTCSLARAPKMCIHRESVQSIVSTA